MSPGRSFGRRREAIRQAIVLLGDRQQVRMLGRILESFGLLPKASGRASVSACPSLRWLGGFHLAVPGPVTICPLGS